MNKPANPIVRVVVTLTEKSILLAEPRNVLSSVGPGPTVFLPYSPEGLSTLLFRPQGVAPKRLPQDKAAGDERPRDVRGCRVD